MSNKFKTYLLNNRSNKSRIYCTRDKNHNQFWDFFVDIAGNFSKASHLKSQIRNLYLETMYFQTYI